MLLSRDIVLTAPLLIICAEFGGDPLVLILGGGGGAGYRVPLRYHDPLLQVMLLIPLRVRLIPSPLLCSFACLDWLARYLLGFGILE